MLRLQHQRRHRGFPLFGDDGLEFGHAFGGEHNLKVVLDEIGPVPGPRGGHELAGNEGIGKPRLACSAVNPPNARSLPAATAGKRARWAPPPRGSISPAGTL